MRFSVHRKPNQQLHYLNRESLHTKACKKAIPEGVHYRLGSLTTLTEAEAAKPVSEVYPEHYEKLEKAGLVKGDPPTMSQIKDWALQKASQDHKQRKSREQRDRDRSTFFVINHSHAWTKPIHKIINASKKDLGLGWLRCKMAYSRFSNLRELFQRDLTSKLNSDVTSLDFENKECNCNPGKDLPCPYNNKCRECIVVYQMQHKVTGHVYIGSTSKHAKKRFQQHTSDIMRYHEKGSKSTSVARFFACTFINWKPGDLSARLVRNSINYSILWQGKPLSTVQTFGTPTCKLCSKKRLEIYKRARFKGRTLINDRTHLFEACKHRPDFHRYTEQEPCTDETQGSRKGPARSNHRVLISM